MQRGLFEDGVNPRDLVKCKGCGRSIIWIETTKGRKVPCEPHQRTIVTSKGQYIKGYEAHFAYCPQAARFRRME